MKNCSNCKTDLTCPINWSKYCERKNILLCLICFKADQKKRRRQCERDRRKDPMMGEKRRQWEKDRRKDPITGQKLRQYETNRRQDPIIGQKLRDYTNNRRKNEEINEREKELERINKLKLKINTLEAYDGICVHCGESNIFHLTLDHINDDGNIERKELKGGVELYAHLKRLNYPDKGTRYQVLCHNCNALKEMTKRFKKDDPDFEFPKFALRDQSNVLNCQKAKELGADKLYEIIKRHKEYK